MCDVHFYGDHKYFEALESGDIYAHTLANAKMTNKQFYHLYKNSEEDFRGMK